MTNLNEKVILTDCDGVLVDWLYGFKEFMAERGYTEQDPTGYAIWKRYGFINKEAGEGLVREFNNSAAMAYLTPNLDAVKYVKKLHEECGYIFKVITSLSTQPHAVDLRKKNLNKLFGTAIDEVVCLETGADKDSALAPYKDSGLLWIEDKYQNAEVGAK